LAQAPFWLQCGVVVRKVMAFRRSLHYLVVTTPTLALALWLWRRRAKQLEKERVGGKTLQELADEIQSLLASRKPRHVEGIVPSLYKLPPFIAKATWTQLGNVLRRHENPDVAEVPGERFITLRLDGSGFSKLTRRMTALGVFSAGYSDEFAEIMRECCQSLMSKFNGVCGYTQSDEMTIVIPAASIVRGEQQCHSHSGRVVKICTLAAAHVTSLFNFRLQATFNQKGVQMEASALATFDCRMGSFATLKEAMSLVLWRAADCGVNGVSDAVYKSKIPGARKVMSQGTGEKLVWLAENGLLPLQSHQAYGSYFVRTPRLHEGVNPKTGETAQSLRSSIEEIQGANVLCLAAEGALFPAETVWAKAS